MKNNSSDCSNSSCTHELSEEAQRLVATINCNSSRQQHIVLVCKPSLESILVTVALTYYAQLHGQYVRLSLEKDCQLQLDEVPIGPIDGLQDLHLVERLITQLQRFYGQPTRYLLAYACSYDDPAMPQAVYEWARMVLHYKEQSQTLLSAVQTEAFLKYARRGCTECEHARQFIRMSKMEDGSYFARFSCKANVLPLVASYFAGRLRTENFAIVDPSHGVALIHTAGNMRCSVILLDEALLQELLHTKQVSNEEHYIRSLWKTFYKKVGFSERGKVERGYDLRTHWMAKRFWSGLHELEPQ
ncbi:MAG: DUF4130 domain-containing protein [Atopobium sp.]|uniref:DUF4130 domain-containing protein n=1 Tax=Atopobium sp. TaxID=1872650 RepID=UPI002A7F5359|nr:DUF4130 domain-containing protein [Atopobium sp.]MDY4522241.1 DUF4130 domain-containing protein [Atopobium sp.]